VHDFELFSIETKLTWDVCLFSALYLSVRWIKHNHECYEALGIISFNIMATVNVQPIRVRRALFCYFQVGRYLQIIKLYLNIFKENLYFLDRVSKNAEM
jgi:hypothetical protein